MRKRSYKNFIPAEFVQAVQQISWLELYLCTDVDTAVEILTNKLTFILDAMAPMRTMQVRTRYAPWLTITTINLMKERDKQQKVASDSGIRDELQKFKALRNQINNRLKFEERNWQKRQLEECGEDSSKIWKNVKSILNWKTSGSPNQLFYKGLLINKPQEIAEAQNQYFLEKIHPIRENLPPAPTDPLQILRSLMEGRTCAFSLTAVHPDEIDKIVSNLSNSSSFGLDMIDTYIIKLIKPDILPALTHIINLSIAANVFPTLWKKSKVIPLHNTFQSVRKGDFQPDGCLFN